MLCFFYLKMQLYLDHLFCPRYIFSSLSKSLIAFEMQYNSTYPDAGYPDAGYPDAGYPDAGYPEAGYPDAGYPVAGYPDAGYPNASYPVAGCLDQLRPSGKFVENSTKLTCLEITDCRIKHITVLRLLELQLRRSRRV